MSHPILYSFRRCPYAIRARLALRYAGIDCELREVVLRDKPLAMLEASPKGTVPVLIVNPGASDQEVIDESLDVMLWALAQHDPDGWLNVDRAQANALIDANDDQFKPWLDRYKYPNRYDDIVAGEPEEQCAAFLAVLEERLKASLFLCGDRQTIADIAIGPFIRQFAFVDIEGFRTGDFRAVNSWLQRFIGSPLFSSVMDKYPQWSPGDPLTVF